MFQRNKRLFLVTSIIILLPILVGLSFWKELPGQMVTHWGADGQPDGWSSKAFAVFGLPLLILAFHIICTFATTTDPKNQSIFSGKILKLVFWICPAVSLFCGFVTYSEALGTSVPIDTLSHLFCGVMFIAVGNYLPKCPQNHTIGIKVPWTLNSTENWNRTHRFAGPIWVICGIAMIATSTFFPFVIFLPIILVMAFLPMVYSYWYYRKYEMK